MTRRHATVARFQFQPVIIPQLRGSFVIEQLLSNLAEDRVEDGADPYRQYHGIALIREEEEEGDRDERRGGLSDPGRDLVQGIRFRRHGCGFRRRRLVE